MTCQFLNFASLTFSLSLTGHGRVSQMKPNQVEELLVPLLRVFVNSIESPEIFQLSLSPSLSSVCWSTLRVGHLPPYYFPALYLSNNEEGILYGML